MQNYIEKEISLLNKSDIIKDIDDVITNNYTFMESLDSMKDSLYMKVQQLKK